MDEWRTGGSRWKDMDACRGSGGMKEWVDGQMDGQTEGWLDEWVDRQSGGWWVDGKMDRKMGGYMNG